MSNLAIVQTQEEDRSEWLRCRSWIEGALAFTGGTHTIEDIEDGIASGTYQFFCSPNSAVVTEIIVYPRAKLLNYFLIGGDLEELVEQIEPHVTVWAKSRGCSRVVGIGRKGFERAFRGSGFKPCWTAISKDI